MLRMCSLPSGKQKRPCYWISSISACSSSLSFSVNNWWPNSDAFSVLMCGKIEFLVCNCCAQLELFIGNAYKDFSTVVVLIHKPSSDGYIYAIWQDGCELWMWEEVPKTWFKLLVSWVSQTRHSSAWNLFVSFCASRSVFFCPQRF